MHYHSCMTGQIPFREHHLLALLEGYSGQNHPIDLYISEYFRSHSALGSKDRAYIANTAYALIRWQGLLDHLSDDSTWKKRFETYQKGNIEELQNQGKISR